MRTFARVAHVMSPLLFASLAIVNTASDLADEQCPIDNKCNDITSFLQTYTHVQKHSHGLPQELEKQAASDKTEWKEAPPEDCQAGVRRFKEIRYQAKGGHEPAVDPLFPPTMESIAPEGHNCGDSARNIQESCDKFNYWHTFQDVAAIIKRPFSVFEQTSGRAVQVRHVDQIQFTDIGQGVLGNCYFLAALAAIANTHPEIIEEMFVDKHLWDQNIFRTRWYINGVETIISVDNMIPGNESAKGGTFFTKPSETGEFWPVILSKTWAKIFGTFKSVEAGNGATVILAITGAPPTSYDHASSTEDENWKLLEDDMKARFPMIAGSVDGAKRYGLASGHAYAILAVETSKEYGRVVKMFNPWRTDHYMGALPKTEELVGTGLGKGAFKMKFDEFLHSFSSTGVSKVHSSYTLLSMKIPVGEAKVAQIGLDEKPGEFYVAINWPNDRMLRPCDALVIDSPPTTILATSIKEIGSREEELNTGKTIQSTNKKLTIQVDLNSFSHEIANPDGGIYLIFAFAKFTDSPAASSQKHVQLSVYAPKSISKKYGIKEPFNWKPTELANAIFLPNSETAGNIGCRTIQVPGHGTFERDDSKLTMPGIPTFWSKDRFLYLGDMDTSEWRLQPSFLFGIIKNQPWLHQTEKGSEPLLKKDMVCADPDTMDK